MLQSTRRYLLTIVLLLLGVGLTWGQRWTLAARTSSVALTSPGGAAGSADAGTELPAEHVYFLDVEGWYRITPFETVVRSPYDLTADSTGAMAAAIPASLGSWQQMGPDEDVGDDPGVREYLREPTVALQRTYQDTLGRQVTLTIIGNKGEDSFLLFSHTPETCYPGRLWQPVESRRESALLDDQPMYAQYLLTEHAQSGERLMVLFWYLWEDPQRRSEEGVLSMRVNLFIDAEQSEEDALDLAWDLIRALFPATVRWDRF